MYEPTVIAGPAAAVTAAEAKASQVFSADDDDSYVELLLSIAQAQIDGWTGWLGRAIGLQTLEVTVPACWTFDRSCLLPPYVDTVTDTLSEDGLTRAFRYRAGYTTVPAPIKHAIILMAGALRDATPSDGGEIKSRTVDGVGRFDYTTSDGAGDAMKNAAMALLANYKVLRV